MRGMDVMAYLLDGDPAIRWQVMRDLTDAPPSEVAAERARVATEGWGARLLAEQGADGLWDGGTYRPGWADESRPFFDAWTATHFSLLSLVEYGLDPESPEARRAIALVRDNARWEYNGELYFQGEAEPCINGGALAVGAYFGQDAAPIAETLLATQHADGGWNCWEEDPATPGSFHSTICALEGLWAWEQATGGSDAVRAARLRGEEYLLERQSLPAKVDGRGRRPPDDDAVVTDALVLRRASRARVLPARAARTAIRAAPRRSSCCGRSGCRWGCSGSRTRTPARPCSAWRRRARGSRADG